MVDRGPRGRPVQALQQRRPARSDAGLVVSRFGVESEHLCQFLRAQRLRVGQLVVEHRKVGLRGVVGALRALPHALAAGAAMQAAAGMALLKRFVGSPLALAAPREILRFSVWIPSDAFARGLLISCAMPAASWPSEVSFSACTIRRVCCSIFFRISTSKMLSALMMK